MLVQLCRFVCSDRNFQLQESNKDGAADLIGQLMQDLAPSSKQFLEFLQSTRKKNMANPNEGNVVFVLFLLCNVLCVCALLCTCAVFCVCTCLLFCMCVPCFDHGIRSIPCQRQISYFTTRLCSAFRIVHVSQP